MPFLENIKDRANQFLDRLALKKLENRVGLILKAIEEAKAFSDKELKLAALAFKDELQKGRDLDSLTVECFAVTAEAARRVLKQSPYPVQILAGLVIHSGQVVEMKAGEGKTLTETMPVYLNSLAGRGVHIITTNDYLAERDAKWMGKLYDFLEMSVGYVSSAMKTAERQEAYGADITYVSNQEVGFDYLRDNLVFSKSDRVLRKSHPLNFGIVDEIDSILIDESRTPLIIAEPVKEERTFYDLFTQVVGKLIEDTDYIVDHSKKLVAITDEGISKAEELLKKPLFSKENPAYTFYLEACLKAKAIFVKDRDYIITGGGVEIVDEFTGRVLPGRRFTDGLHQALEAKEKVKINDTDKTRASITFQNFFPMYEKLSGMSGTVMRARDELNKVYKLEVVQIPTNRPIIRVDHPDLFFKTEKGKFSGLLRLVEEIYRKGQPLLLGTRNVETAHKLANLLDGNNYPFLLLTAKDDRAEAQKIAMAGQKGMITLATNMAGRGTDILLGDGVESLGGLFVIGTERHESRRVDDQLIGRSGRQGEKGESIFLVSMEDEIMQLFGDESIIDVMENLDIAENEYISGASLSRAFSKAQEFVDSRNLDSRLYLYKYDAVVNFQRKAIYGLRESLLENQPEFSKFFKECIAEIFQYTLALKDPELITKQLLKIFRLNLPAPQITSILGLSPQKHQKKFITAAARQFLEDLQNLASSVSQNEVFSSAQNLLLQIIDDCWGGHLELMETLKEEASLFSYATPDPLIDYALESRQLYKHLQTEIKERFVSLVFGYFNRKGSAQILHRIVNFD